MNVRDSLADYNVTPSSADHQRTPTLQETAAQLGDVLDKFLKSTEWFREAINESCQEGSEGGVNKNDFLAYMSLGAELVTKVLAFVDGPYCPPSTRENARRMVEVFETNRKNLEQAMLQGTVQLSELIAYAQSVGEFFAACNAMMQPLRP